MTRMFCTVLIGALLCGPVTAEPDVQRADIGGDSFVSGRLLDETLEAPGDAFLAGRTVRAHGRSNGDIHAAGFDVTVDAAATGDLYAAGAFVLVQSRVTEDLTASGFSVRTGNGSAIGGNARLFGRKVTIEGPIDGALLVTAQDVVLNAAVQGDVRIVAQSIAFGPEALVGGTLTYSAREPVTVPNRVAPEERVVFERLSASAARDRWRELRKEMPVLPAFASLVFGFIVSLLFFIALGALMLGFMPKRLSRMRRSIAAAPGQTLVLGVIGLSILFGLVPITGLTIIGLPFVPIVLLSIVVAWTLGYALGAYSVAMRVWTGFGGEEDPSRLTRLSVFAAAIVVVALLNFIPFVGWVANYTLVLLGLGAMTSALFHYMIGNPGDAFDIDLKPVDERS
ncbi:hypothetical protein [Roseobacter sinensis]|uniref:DUF8173 domain-containing protein n=1 Tax=Roseobacter sinensis TaxID=2931391 RepID=A0ABT3BD37_9RHOB|nr:hypothetical protein [Roseobacter sp. WL0113]MCV3271491.1 hypothetical protein [Roseobacter sp. WL0113]